MLIGIDNPGLWIAWPADTLMRHVTRRIAISRGSANGDIHPGQSQRFPSAAESLQISKYMQTSFMRAAYNYDAGQEAMLECWETNR